MPLRRQKTCFINITDLIIVTIENVKTVRGYQLSLTAHTKYLGKLMMN